MRADTRDIEYMREALELARKGECSTSPNPAVGCVIAKDDEIIGLKLTSIKFKNNPYKFLYLCYSTFFLTLIILGYMTQLNRYYWIVLVFVIVQMFFFSIKKIRY